MSEPHLTRDASTAIDEYALRLARRSQLPFALAEDARRELAAHVTDVAIERARHQGRAEADAMDARGAIENMGNDSAVLGAFFQSAGTGHETSRFAYGRAFLLLIAACAAATTLLALVVSVNDIDFQLLLGVLPSFAAAAFGSAAIWMLPARWSFAAAAVVFVLPLMMYSAGGADDDLLFWIVPGTFIVLGGVIRSQIPTGNQPVGRLAFDMQPIVNRVTRDWKRLGHIVLATVTVLAAAIAFPAYLDTGFWLPGVVMLAVVFAGVFLLGRVRAWIPFALACALFVAVLALSDYVGAASGPVSDQGHAADLLYGTYPAVLLGLSALFVGAFPRMGRNAKLAAGPLKAS